MLLTIAQTNFFSYVQTQVTALTNLFQDQGISLQCK
jgi:hypothetical protein